LIVDDDVYDFINSYTWALRVNFRNPQLRYAQVTFNGENIAMHHLVLAATEGFDVDHVNGNGLDNRKENLRLATRSQNVMNSRKSRRNCSSKFKGVSWVQHMNQWKAEITLNGKRKYLGCHDEEISAARAYNRAAIRYFGEFARLNEFNDPLVGSEK
jgi:hypothetical protein